MTRDDDVRRIGGALAALGAVFDVEMSEEKASAYLHILSRFDVDRVLAAIDECAATLTFFPRPAEIVERIVGSPDAQALDAWEEAYRTFENVGVYRSPSFEDTRITATILDMGGWINFCNHMDPVWSRKAFVKSYAARLSVACPPAKRLVGLMAGERVLVRADGARARRLQVGGAGPETQALPGEAADEGRDERVGLPPEFRERARARRGANDGGSAS